MREGARGWCTGMTQRGGMGREVGGGFRMGNTCTPVADSCQCMAKPLQCCKVISLQLKKKEYRSGLPFPPSENLPDSGLESMSSVLAGRFLTTEPPGKPKNLNGYMKY